MLAEIADWDRRVLWRVYNLRHPRLTKFFKGISYVASLQFWAAITLLVFIPAEFVHGFFPVYASIAHFIFLFCKNILTTFLVSTSIMLPIKYVIYRLRPFQKYVDVTRREQYVKDPSFPSGHCVQWILFGWVVSSFLLGEWFMLLFVLTVPLIMLARIHLGSHFPSDTIAGVGLGAILILVVSLSIPYFNAWYNWIGDLF